MRIADKLLSLLGRAEAVEPTQSHQDASQQEIRRVAEIALKLVRVYTDHLALRDTHKVEYSHIGELPAPAIALKNALVLTAIAYVDDADMVDFARRAYIGLARYREEAREIEVLNLRAHLPSDSSTDAPTESVAFYSNVWVPMWQKVETEKRALDLEFTKYFELYHRPGARVAPGGSSEAS